MKVAARYLLLLIPFTTALVHAQIRSFKNVVVIVQENRTPDNLFQGLCTTRTACSTTPTGKQYNIQTKNWLDNTSPTGVTQPLTIPLANTYDLTHAHWVWVKQCDENGAGKCLMDGCLLYTSPSPRD